MLGTFAFHTLGCQVFFNWSKVFPWIGGEISCPSSKPSPHWSSVCLAPPLNHLPLLQCVSCPSSKPSPHWSSVCLAPPLNPLPLVQCVSCPSSKSSPHLSSVMGFRGRAR